MPPEPTFIYAFKNTQGKFLYVGQSVDPMQRRFFHTHATASKIKHLLPKRVKFCVIRQTTTERANRIEHQVIRALKRRGEATLNQRLACDYGETFCGGYPVDGFNSIAQRARYLKRIRNKNQTSKGN